MTGRADRGDCYMEIQAGAGERCCMPVSCRRRGALPHDPPLRAGGVDSCDWVAMLTRMYRGWTERKGYQGAPRTANCTPAAGASRSLHAATTVDEQPAEAGLRSVSLRVAGAFAYGWARTEAGVHRLVRMSPFDAQARGPASRRRGAAAELLGLCSNDGTLHLRGLSCTLRRCWVRAMPDTLRTGVCQPRRCRPRGCARGAACQ